MVPDQHIFMIMVNLYIIHDCVTVYDKELVKFRFMSHENLLRPWIIP